MTAGFESYTSDGRLQAHSDMFGYHLRKTGTAQTVARSFGNTEASDLVIPRTGVSGQAVCAVQCKGHGVGFIGFSSSGFCFVSDAPPGTTVNYYIFDSAGAVPASVHGVGIEVFSSTGQVTFSSAYHPMNTVGLLSFGDALSRPYYGNGSSVTLAGRSLACMQGAPAGRTGPMGLKTCWIAGVAHPLGPPEGQTCDFYTYDNNGKIYGGQVSTDGTNASHVAISWDDVTVTDPEGDDQSWSIPSKIFVVDVTGFPLGATYF